jgi:signal transduction histidine kinase
MDWLGRHYDRRQSSDRWKAWDRWKVFDRRQIWQRWRGRHGLARLFRRRLFWRFYFTLLASLMIMVVLGGLIWRTVAEAPISPGYELEARLSEALLPPPNAPLPVTQAALSSIAAELHGRVTLIGPDGRAIAAAGLSDDPHDLIRDPSDVRVPRGRTFRAWRVDLPDGRILIARGLHNFMEGPPAGFYYLFIVGLGVGIAAFPFVLRITRRLERLRQAVENWGAGHLETRVPERGEDEIASVARSFNVAAARIEALVAAHRTLLANASHELRSPLARLRMAVEVYQTAPDDALKRSIAQDIGEVDQLVEEILLASRLDHSGVEFERDTVDLLGLVAEEAARVDATLDAVGDSAALMIHGSARLLRRLIRNLLENARRHGAPPMEIHLASTLCPDRTKVSMISLTVTDHGTGIPDAERTRVFEPFYRPAGRAETGGSWGLGLALVARIAVDHGGTVRCAAGADGGAVFVVELPTRVVDPVP